MRKQFSKQILKEEELLSILGKNLLFLRFCGYMTFSRNFKQENFWASKILKSLIFRIGFFGIVETFCLCVSFPFVSAPTCHQKRFLFVVLKLFWWGNHFPFLFPKENTNLLKKWPLTGSPHDFVGNSSGKFKNENVKKNSQGDL